MSPWASAMGRLTEVLSGELTAGDRVIVGQEKQE